MSLTNNLTLGDDSNDKAKLYQPSIDELELIGKVNSLYALAKNIKKDKDDMFEKAFEFIRGKQWEIPKPIELSDATLNIMRATKDTKKSILLDASPVFNIVPTTELPTTVKNSDGAMFTLDQEKIMKLKALLEDYGYTHWHIEEALEEAIDDALVYGTAILKVIYDDYADNGNGNIAVSRVNPRNFYISQGAEKDIQKAYYIIETRIMRLDEIMLEFPEKGKYVMPEQGVTKKMLSEYQDDNNASSGLVIESLNKDTEYFDKSKDMIGYDLQYSEVKELWIHDLEAEEYEDVTVNEETSMIVMDPKGMPLTIKKQRLKYPGGRHIIWANNVLLVNEANNLIDKKFPYVIIRNNSEGGSFWGTGEFETGHDIQRAINRIMCNLIDWSNGAYNKHVVEDGAIVNNTNIQDKAWQILKVTDINKYRQEVAPPPPSGLFELLQVLRGVYDSLSGVHETTRGESSSAAARVGVAQQLRQADFTKLKLIVRSLERALSELGTMCLSRLIQFEHLDRMYHFIDPTTQLPQAIQLEGFPSDIDLVLKVEVKSNSTLPKDKPSLAALALQLQQRGIIGPIATLKTLEWPNIDEAIEEVNMLKQLQEQLQQSQMQQAQMQQAMQQQSQQAQGQLKQAQTQIQRKSAEAEQANKKAQAADIRSKLAALTTMVRGRMQNGERTAKPK